MADSIVTPLEDLRKFLLGERTRVIEAKAGMSRSFGNTWFLAEGEREALQSVIEELDRIEAAAKDSK